MFPTENSLNRFTFTFESGFSEHLELVLLGAKGSQCQSEITQQGRQDAWVVWAGGDCSPLLRYTDSLLEIKDVWSSRFINTFEVWCQFHKDKLISLASQPLMASMLTVLSSGKSSSISPCHGLWELSKSSVTYPCRGGGLASKAQFTSISPSGRLCMGGSEGREFSSLWEEYSDELISQLLAEFLPLTFVLGKSCKPNNPTQT